MFLATTALEQYWEKTHKILFLGEWCKIFNKKQVWEHLDYEVLPYHWDDRQRLYTDFLYLQDVYETFLKYLSLFLNRYHSENNSTLYWRIIIGPWLLYFIQTVYDRYYCLKKASELKSDLETYIVNDEYTPSDLQDYLQKFISDEYNLMVYSQIIKNCDMKISFKSADFPSLSLQPPDYLIKKTTLSIKSKIKHFLFDNELGLLIQSFVNDTYFINSYLPYDILNQVYKKLKQIPYSYNFTLEIPAASQKDTIRNKGAHLVTEDGFCTLVSKIILLNIPTIYLENYKNIKNTILRRCPNKPKIIFTSNDHIENDVFKIWTAYWKERKAKLIIAQHGGGYGALKFYAIEKHEKKIADYFLTWGWKEKENNVIPFYNIKIDNASIPYNASGKITLIGVSYPRYSYHLYAVPVGNKIISYLKSIILLYQHLDRDVLSLLYHRLYYDYGWNERERLQDSFPELKFEDMSSPYKDSIKTSRLCICTYNATTFLETFQMNIPTILFWEPEYFELRESAVPYFDYLLENGILFYSAEKCAKTINAIYTNPLEWWMQSNIQNAVKNFCDYFSRTSDYLAENIVDFINKTKSLPSHRIF